MPERRHKLSAPLLALAHARPWEGAACARFLARTARLSGLGFTTFDAEDLAERWHLGDVTADDRGWCIGCTGLAGSVGALRCTRPRSAGIGASPLVTDFATLRQRCPAYIAAEGQT